MTINYNKWNKIYRNNPLNTLGWELGRLRPVLVKLIKKSIIRKGKTLDVCCGAGTNSIYLVKKGFSVTPIDISPTAIRHAKKESAKEKLIIDLSLQNFVKISFIDDIFDFVFDMGCFHHVSVIDRIVFIEGINRALRRNGLNLLTCFSNKNGSSWNHFKKKQLIQLFSNYFKIIKLDHYSSIEGDGIERFFYTILLEK